MGGRKVEREDEWSEKEKAFNHHLKTIRRNCFFWLLRDEKRKERETKRREDRQKMSEKKRSGTLLAIEFEND